nr:cytochrome c oxidase subunit III [Peloridora minuta]
MKLHLNHPFHLVNPSPWPIINSLNLMNLLLGLLKWTQTTSMNLVMLSMISIVITSLQWWRDMIRESTFQGLHSMQVQLGLKMGMIMFIISEVMFFISFFWAYFHTSLSPSMEIGLNWPPSSIIPFNPMSMPLLNTMILLCSGMTITWSHYCMVNNNMKNSQKTTLMTLLLGLYFSSIQTYEYLQAPFSISDSIYGSTFFVMTGFHGIHVFIGTCFIGVEWMRTLKNQFSKVRHLGIEMAAWYWHFVDVVWLFLFIAIYWWGK